MVGTRAGVVGLRHLPPGSRAALGRVAGRTAGEEGGRGVNETTNETRATGDGTVGMNDEANKALRESMTSEDLEDLATLAGPARAQP